MSDIEVLTYNSMYNGEKCVGGYHEIHEIKNLQNIKHLIATIDSIVKNNLLYGCDETMLESISVFCGDKSIIDVLNKHYKGFCGKVKIKVEVIVP